MTAEYPQEFLLRNQPALDRFATRQRFCGHNVVVTGGASGIGLATVERFLNDGADHVAIFDRDALRGAAAVEDIVKVRRGRRRRRSWAFTPRNDGSGKTRLF